MASIQEAYAHANRVHQAGDLRQADAIYRQILQAIRHADSMHFLGVIAMQSGQAENAIEIINRSIAMRPEPPPITIISGRRIRCCDGLTKRSPLDEKAAQLQPENPDFISGLAYACYLKGDISRAEALCLTGLRPIPITPSCGTRRKHPANSGPNGRSCQYVPQDGAIQSAACRAHNNLACTLQILRRPDEAIVHYRQALALSPNYIESAQ